MAAHVISYRESDRHMVSRLLLESGEKVFIKVVGEPTFFVGVWRLGSFNPITLLVDWAMSKFSGVRTAGMAQLWGLGADALGDSDLWLKAIMLMFNPAGEPRTVLSCVTTSLQQCRSIEEVESFLRGRGQEAAAVLGSE